MLIILPFVFFEGYTPVFFEPTQLNSLPVMISILGNQNNLAFVALLGLLPSLSDYLNNKNVYSAFMTSIPVIGLALARSRAAILAAVISFSILYFYTHSTLYGKLVTATFLTVGSIITLIRIRAIPGPDIIQSISLSHREILWKESTTIFVQNPILGNGARSFGTEITESLSFNVGTVHNAFLTVFLQTGLVGGALYALFISYVLVQIHKLIVYTNKYDKDNAHITVLFALITSIVIISVFSTKTAFGSRYSDVCIALSFGYACNEISSNNSDE